MFYFLKSIMLEDSPRVKDLYYLKAPANIFHPSHFSDEKDVFPILSIKEYMQRHDLK